MRTFDGRGTIEPGRSFAPFELVSGFAEVIRALFALVHGRQFTGQLGRPLIANALAFAAVFALFWFGLLPAYESWFAGDPDATNDAGLWALATAVLLAPPLLELFAGPAQERLLAISELAILGVDPADSDAGPGTALRLRDRLIVLAAAVAMLPLLLAVVQLPWVGVPIAIATGAVVAAITWLEPPLARAGYDLKQRIALLRQNPWRTVGLGIGLQTALVVPFFNLLMVSSVAAVASTCTFLRFAKQPA